MISNKDFAAAKTITCSDFSTAVVKAEEIRNNNDYDNYIIFIQNSSCAACIKTKISGFYFRALNNKVEVHGSRAAKDHDESGMELSTWKTATVKLVGDNNIFEGLTFYNDGSNPQQNGQMVALEVLGDNNLFIDCTVVSTQDTLFVGPLPDDLAKRYRGFLPEDECDREGNTCNYFKRCTIKGSIDFIFGAGQALFDRCHLVSVEDGREGPFFVVAPSHSLKDPIGYVFYRCSFSHEFERLKSVYLARPWRDFGKAVFFNCTYGEHINPAGFSDWNEEERTGTARFEEYPFRANRVGWANRKKLREPRKEIRNLIAEYEFTNC